MTPSAGKHLIDLLDAQINAADAANAGPGELKDWKAQTGVVLRAAVGEANDLVTKFEAVRYHYTGPRWSGMNEPDHSMYRRNGIQSAVALLKAAKTSVQINGVTATTSQTSDTGQPPAEIFIVHGHDKALKAEVARFLLQLTNQNPVILHEQLNAGATIIEKFEQAAAKAAYAVVLATADDFGRRKDLPEELPRARQNVIFELGYFFAALGRQRVAMLYDPSVDRPSDTNGILHIVADEPGAWKIQLTNEIEGAGISVDRNALR